jgi:nucleolar protein 12
MAGRAGKLLGRVASGQINLKPGERPTRLSRRARDAVEKAGGSDDNGHDPAAKSIKTPEDIVFEGRRASAKDGRPKDLRFKGKKSGSGKAHKKRTAHAKARASKWKAEG